MVTRVKSVGALVAAIRFFRDNPDGKIKGPDWTQPTWTRVEFIRWFRECLENKINAQDQRFPKGRKADGEYQLKLCRLRGLIGNRVAIYPDQIDGMGPRVKAALRHRLRENS